MAHPSHGCAVPPACSTENEKNRRRDLVSTLRTKRDQMLAQLKREQPRAARDQLLGGSAAGGAGAGGGRETDTTAELGSQALLQLQNTTMQRQDQDLESLERTVVGTKHIALQINEEVDLHTRLLDNLDEEVDGTRSRMAAAQRRLKLVMRRGGACKTQLLCFLVSVVLVVVCVIGELGGREGGGQVGTWETACSSSRQPAMLFTAALRYVHPRLMGVSLTRVLLA